MAAAKTTTDHDEIRRWVEKNGGWPARVKATGSKKGDPGILRIDYPGFSGEETLAKMNWDQWFEWFDKNALAFVYQPNTRFSKLVARAAGQRRTATGRRTPGAKRTSARATSRPSARTSTRAKRRTTATRTPKRATKRTTRATAKRPAKRTSKRTARKA